jgi:hypothetical protein
MICSTTFAWLIANKKVTDLIEIEAGSLSIDSIQTTAYRYDFEEIGTNTGFFDYTKGSVNTHATDDCIMNLYDPVYLTIYKDVTLSELKTNLVLKLDITVTANCGYDFNVYANRKIANKPTGYTDGVGNYLDFVCLNQETLDAETITNVNPTANDNIFYKAKQYAEKTTTTKESFRTGETTIDKVALIESTSPVSGPVVTDTSLTTVTTLYINLDYNQDSLSKYSDDQILDKYKFYMDYGFSIDVRQNNG